MELRPRLRDSARLETATLYPLNVFPIDVVQRVGGYFVYLMYIGRKDISGEDWGDAFADAIGGRHLNSPVGVADVEFGKNGWSMKTVKSNDPFNQESVRLISGRCSPDYSYGITDPHEDVQKTGTAVLNIWNERINIATDQYSRVRTAVLVRSYDLLSYALFEEETQRYRTTDYTWTVNRNGNLIGCDGNGKTCFTWQPHGSQFTIHTEVPKTAIKFRIRRPPSLNKETVLKSIDFDEKWISILSAEGHPSLGPSLAPTSPVPGFLPRYSLQAACGTIGAVQIPEEVERIPCYSLMRKFNPKTCFIVQATGRSMLEGIQDWDLCVFEKGEGQVGDVVLVQRLQKFAESGGSYVIKRLKENHVLVSDNEKENRDLYQSIDMKQFERNEISVIGVLRGILCEESNGIYRCL